MMKTFFATTAIVGTLFIAQPGYTETSVESVAELLENYQDMVGQLNKKVGAMEAYHKQISKAVAKMQASGSEEAPTAAEISALKSLVESDLEDTTEYTKLLDEYDGIQDKVNEARQTYFEDTETTIESVIPIAPPLPDHKPSKTTAEAEIKKITPSSETVADIEKETKEEFVKEEAEILAKDKSVQPKDVKADARKSIDLFTAALKKQAARLQSVEEAIKTQKASKAMQADPEAEKEAESLEDILKKGMAAKFGLIKQIEEDEEEWEEEIDDWWEKDTGATPS